MDNPSHRPRGLLHSGAGPLLWALLFIAVFAATYALQTPSPLVVSNGTIREIFQKYGIAAGPALGLLGLIVMYLLAGVKRIAGLRKFGILNPCIVLAVSLPALAFGYQLAYREPAYTDIARAIIGSLAMPLLVASAAVSALAALWFILLLVRKD